MHFDDKMALREKKAKLTSISIMTGVFGFTQVPIQLAFIASGTGKNIYLNIGFALVGLAGIMVCMYARRQINKIKDTLAAVR